MDVIWQYVPYVDNGILFKAVLPMSILVLITTLGPHIVEWFTNFNSEYTFINTTSDADTQIIHSLSDAAIEEIFTGRYIFKYETYRRRKKYNEHAQNIINDRLGLAAYIMEHVPLVDLAELVNKGVSRDYFTDKTNKLYSETIAYIYLIYAATGLNVTMTVTLSIGCVIMGFTYNASIMVSKRQDIWIRYGKYLSRSDLSAGDAHRLHKKYIHDSYKYRLAKSGLQFDTPWSSVLPFFRGKVIDVYQEHKRSVRGYRY